MGLYEDLCIANDNIEIKETNRLPNFQPGCYMNGEIFIKSNLSDTRKAEVLYEELGHHAKTYGNILDQSKWINRKFESYAVRHGYEASLPFRLIIEAYHYGVSNLYELSQYLQLSENYITKVLKFYKQKYGLDIYYKGYVIKFEPLQVFKHYEIN
ncbi:toxin [Staphylococcus gallinarum]|uniref:ImmA/IrrE family metallo-endopeptidase n=1 Tax=Staphylococcus gallinarum TaxID=1293 RepID=UPI000D1FAA00|nr:toxin [Staphylococcus gallinarum]MCD8872087.1 toxin [Staphylococcus gallinarum]PTL18595.1 toxin [Staphylococcus gallinarum]RIO78839.1 toxin [Staphylococcus gallinarum]